MSELMIYGIALGLGALVALAGLGQWIVSRRATSEEARRLRPMWEALAAELGGETEPDPRGGPAMVRVRVDGVPVNLCSGSFDGAAGTRVFARFALGDGPGFEVAVCEFREGSRRHPRPPPGPRMGFPEFDRVYGVTLRDATGYQALFDAETARELIDRFGKFQLSTGPTGVYLTWPGLEGRRRDLDFALELVARIARYGVERFEAIADAAGGRIDLGPPPKVTLGDGDGPETLLEPWPHEAGVGARAWTELRGDTPPMDLVLPEEIGPDFPVEVALTADVGVAILTVDEARVELRWDEVPDAEACAAGVRLLEELARGRAAAPFR